ncbi:MAG: M28 family peptidase, partial [Syntrophothermus sp.]
YIAQQFRNAGIPPAGASYLHEIKFGKTSLGEDNQLRISRNGSARSFAIKSDFTPLEMTASREISAGIVFAGYGITAPEYNYDDYKGLDVKGKIVFLLRHEPGENDSLSVFDGARLTDYSQIGSKVANAIDHGAAGVMLATDPLNHAYISSQGYPWPSLSKFIPKDALPVNIIEEDSLKIPVIQAGKEVITGLFGSVDSLKMLEQEIDKSLKPHSFLIHGADALIKTSTRIDEKPGSLVAALIEGNDPELKKEIVVLGAHYDHVGTKKQEQPGEDYIFNGADDNASGTSAVIAIANAFGKSGIRTKRSILLLAFPGEEIGLMGSAFYASHPLFPFEKTIAMMNLDMIGRNAPEALCVIGATRCPELDEILRQENNETGFILDYSKEYFLSRSDQANFLKKNVPVLFLTTGEHSDYHKVSDEASRIDYNKAEKVTRLAFRTLFRIADDNRHYTIKSNKVSLF